MWGGSCSNQDNTWCLKQVRGGWAGEEGEGLEACRRWDRGAWLTGYGGWWWRRMQSPPRPPGRMAVRGWEISFLEDCGSNGLREEQERSRARGRLRKGHGPPMSGLPMRRVLLEALWEAGGKRSRASLCGEKQVGPGGPESVQPGLLVHHREPRASRQQPAGQWCPGHPEKQWPLVDDPGLCLGPWPSCCFYLYDPLLSTVLEFLGLGLTSLLLKAFLLF